VVLSPSPAGWELWQEHLPNHVWKSDSAPALAELVPKLRDRHEIQLLLPVRGCLFHQLRLPVTEIEDAASMAELQIEKFLPFLRSDVPVSIGILNRADEHAVVTTTLASPNALGALAESLVSARHWPVYLGLRMEAIARQCPPDGTYLLLDMEDGDIVLALAHHSALAFAEVIAGREDEPPTGDYIERVLWEMRMTGLPTQFNGILIGDSLSDWRQPLADHFQIPCQGLPFKLSWPVPAGDLTPASWRAARKLREARRAQATWLFYGGLLYFALVLAIAGYLYYLGQDLRRLQAEVDARMEQVDEMDAMKADWEIWTPALSPESSVIQIVQQLHQALPSPEVKLTILRVSPDQVLVQGEAPNLSLANTTIQAIETTLTKTYLFQHPPPSLLSNGRARFQITGKRRS
jgi:Tfp pilus assembly protein PilN